MTNSTSHPVASPTVNGRRVLHVRQTTTVRRLRTDRESEAALTWLKIALAGERPEDQPSISLLVRRALKLYRAHIATLSSSPHSLVLERQRVREGSRLPTLRKPLPVPTNVTTH